MEQVLMLYPLRVERIDEIRPKRVWKVKGDTGAYALKKVSYPLEELRFILAALEHLNTHGFCHFAQLATTTRGGKLVIYNGEIYILSQWLKGAQADYDDTNQLVMTARKVAELHKASRGFSPRVEFPSRSNWGLWPHHFSNRIQHLRSFKEMVKAKSPLGEMDDLFITNVDRMIAASQGALEFLNKTNYIAVSARGKATGWYCHHDLAQHNVIINQGNVSFIDFDYSFLDIPHHDLASLIIRKLRYSQWNPVCAWQIIDSYTEILPLNTDDLLIILALMMFPHEFWQYAFFYYVERTRSESECIGKMNRAIEMQEHREASLAELVGGVVKKGRESL